MRPNLEEQIQIYIRELNNKRLLLAAIGIAVAVVTVWAAVSWPKAYTASSTIYADNRNILQPLMAGDAVAPSSGDDQARMAREILFNRAHTDPILEAGGWDVTQLTQLEKDQLIRGIQARTEINNVGRGAARLVMISHSDADPTIAFSIVQKYTSIFIEQASISGQEESRTAFQFIERQVASYQQKLQDSEARLSEFKSENNFGTLANANNRIAGYTRDAERLQLDLVQINTQIETVESQLAGEVTVLRDMGEINSIRARINSLQITLDALRSRFHDSYPDVVQVKNQIADLEAMLESGAPREYAMIESFENETVTPLHQELRSRLAMLQSERQSKMSERDSLYLLLEAEQERARRINETEAELAELTRDYNVTQSFYNSLLGRLENARVSMHLNEEEQGIVFKIQEAAVVPTQPDGFSFSQLLMGSVLLAFAAPIGLLVIVMEVDPRIRAESGWSEDWPPLLGTVPPLSKQKSLLHSKVVFLALLAVIALALYGSVVFMKLTGVIE